MQNSQWVGVDEETSKLSRRYFTQVDWHRCLQHTDTYTREKFGHKPMGPVASKGFGEYGSYEEAPKDIEGIFSTKSVGSILKKLILSQLSFDFEETGKWSRRRTICPTVWPADWIPPHAETYFPSMALVPGAAICRMKPLLETIPPFKLISDVQSEWYCGSILGIWLTITVKWSTEGRCHGDET